MQITRTHYLFGVALTAATLAVGALALAQTSSARDPAPKGCSEDIIDHYYDKETGMIDFRLMNELLWVPVSAADEGIMVGCTPRSLSDPTNDRGVALDEFGQGDPNVPLPIFTPAGDLYGYFVVYEGAVPLSDAIDRGLVPQRLVDDPPVVTDFDPDFESNDTR